MGPASVPDLIAAAVRQRECVVAFTQARQITGEIKQPLSDEVDDVAFALNLPVDAHHRCRHQNPPLALE